MPDPRATRRRDAGDTPTPAVLETPGHLIRRAQQRHTVLWSREFGGDLTGPQYAVISAIGSDDGLDQRAVGQRASLDKSSVTDIVTRLEGVGWLRFAKDPVDGRRKSLRLTPLARTALGDVTRRVGLVQEGLLAPLAPAGIQPFLRALQLVAYAGKPPEPRWADEQVLQLGRTPGHLIRRAQQVHTMAWSDEVGRTVTGPQYAVLSVLRAHPEGIDQSTGAELASVDTSSMADIVARLVKRGWVAGMRDPADARRRLLNLTDAVRDHLVELAPAVERVQQRLLRPLPRREHRTILLNGLRMLTLNVDGEPNTAGKG